MALLVTRRVEVMAYDQNLSLTGVVVGRNSGASSASFTVRHNGVGTGSVTLPVDHKMVPVLALPGARLQYRYLYDLPPVLQMSVPMLANSATLDARAGTVTFTSVSDETLLAGVLGWPKPESPLASQTDEYDIHTGAIDAAVWTIISDNVVSRLGLNVTMIPIVTSGPTGTIKARMQPLAEIVYPPMEAANYSIRMYQWNPGDAVPFFLMGPGQLDRPTILVDITATADRPYVEFTPVLGITTGTASATAPSATRVIVGGQGEGTARAFTQFTSALEAEWGGLWTREVFVDARDTNDVTTTAQRGADALKAGEPGAALTVTTIDGEPWTVGTHYQLGDRVKIAAISGQPVATETVRAITVSVDPRTGTTITPQIGDSSATADPDAVLARAIRNIAARLSDLESRK